jgi:hypothetical protein
MNTLKLPVGTKFKTTMHVWRAGREFKPCAPGVILETLLPIHEGIGRYSATLRGVRVIVFSNEIKEL